MNIEDIKKYNIDYYDEDTLSIEFDKYVNKTCPPPRIVSEWGTFFITPSAALYEVDGGDTYLKCSSQSHDV